MLDLLLSKIRAVVPQKDQAYLLSGIYKLIESDDGDVVKHSDQIVRILTHEHADTRRLIMLGLIAEAAETRTSLAETKFASWLANGGCMECSGVGIIHTPAFRSSPYNLCLACNGSGPKLYQARSLFTRQHGQMPPWLIRQTSQVNVPGDDERTLLTRLDLVLHLKRLMCRAESLVSPPRSREPRIGDLVYALGTWEVGRIVGLAHYGPGTNHLSVWTPKIFELDPAFKILGLPIKNLPVDSVLEYSAAKPSEIFPLFEFDQELPELSDTNELICRTKCISLVELGVINRQLQLSVRTAPRFWENELKEICQKLQ